MALNISIEEYNCELDDVELEFESGDFITHQVLLQKIVLRQPVAGLPSPVENG
jgi:hypothetical protein